jgi:hypothetical protein
MPPTLRLPRKNPKSRAFLTFGDPLARLTSLVDFSAITHFQPVPTLILELAAGRDFSGLFPVVINLPADYALM